MYKLKEWVLACVTLLFVGFALTACGDDEPEMMEGHVPTSVSELYGTWGDDEEAYYLKEDGTGIYYDREDGYTHTSAFTWTYDVATQKLVIRHGDSYSWTEEYTVEAISDKQIKLRDSEGDVYVYIRRKNVEGGNTGGETTPGDNYPHYIGQWISSAGLIELNNNLEGVLIQYSYDGPMAQALRRAGVKMTRANEAGRYEVKVRGGYLVSTDGSFSLKLQFKEVDGAPYIGLSITDDADEEYFYFMQRSVLQGVDPNEFYGHTYRGTVDGMTSEVTFGKDGILTITDADGVETEKYYYDAANNSIVVYEYADESDHEGWIGTLTVVSADVAGLFVFSTDYPGLILLSRVD